MTAAPTIEVQACALLGTILAECVRQRTALGVVKYGQTLDENRQPQISKIVHLIQELLDGIQYALWAGEPETARRLSTEANALAYQYGLTAEEIMAGGKV